MLNRLKNLFASKPAEPSQDEINKRANAWHEKKSQLMERILGAQHDHVMHAVIPYEVGGWLDLYYYPHGIPGTAVATKELSPLPNQGPSNKVFSCYELVMFTRQPFDLASATDAATPFGQTHGNISGLLNFIARYSATAVLNPHDTCEFPPEFDFVGGKCLIFDAYGEHDQAAGDFGLMLLLEVHRSEMDFARASGTAVLLDLLKRRGHYPYSDLNREPVA